MKNYLLYIILSILFLAGCAKEPIYKEMCCTPCFMYTPKVYDHQVTLAFCYISAADNIELIMANKDSLISKIVFPETFKSSGEEYGITIGFKLDSTRIAKDIYFYNGLSEGSEKPITNALKSFKFRFENENKSKNLDAILTFCFKSFEKGKNNTLK